jgi:hypothetical protein
MVGRTTLENKDKEDEGATVEELRYNGLGTL